MFNDIESILIGVVLIGIFIPIMCVLAKKSNEKTKERVMSLTEDQKECLTNTPYQSADNMPKAVVVHGLIHEVTNKTNSNVSLAVMYYNRYYPNYRDQITHLDVKMPLKTFEDNNLKAGDYIKVLLNEDKTPKFVI